MNELFLRLTGTTDVILTSVFSPVNPLATVIVWARRVRPLMPDKYCTAFHYNLSGPNGSDAGQYCSSMGWQPAVSLTGRRLSKPWLFERTFSARAKRGACATRRRFAMSSSQLSWEAVFAAKRAERHSGQVRSRPQSPAHPIPKGFGVLPCAIVPGADIPRRFEATDGLSLR